MRSPDLAFEDSAKGIFREHRSALTSESIIELAGERIFDRNWLYIGQVLKLPERGDYLRRTVRTKPSIRLTRVRSLN